MTYCHFGGIGSLTLVPLPHTHQLGSGAAAMPFDVLVAPLPLQHIHKSIAVVGNVDAGKSTLIGTLTTSSLDDGRGKSRTSIMKHRHEIESGRTSTAYPKVLFSQRSMVVKACFAAVL
jgi:2-methylaconitate cis-trans-isomerase PrpF